MQFPTSLVGYTVTSKHIPLVLADGAADELVALSEGTVGIESSPLIADSFETGAIIPAPPWTLSSDLSLLRPPARPLELAGTVTCLQVPSTISNPLQRYSADHLAGRDSGVNPGVSLGDATAPLTHWLHTIARFSALIPNGIAVRKRSNTPMTVNGKTGLRVGLHVDSWDGLALREREQGRLRLCVNVGVGVRYFLFVPIAVSSIASSPEYLNEENRLSAGATDVAQAFLRLRPEIPVVRLMIKPGWAYIGPTENVVHDACAEEDGGRDMSLHATVTL